MKRYILTLLLFIFTRCIINTQVNIEYSSVTETKGPYQILRVTLINKGNNDIIHTSKKYIKDKYEFKCLVNKNIDFLADFEGNAEMYQNGLVQVNAVKSDTLKSKGIIELTFKYKVKYCLSDSRFVLRVYDPLSKSGKKILFPLDYMNVIREEPLNSYDE
jgi:hypothetical protein